VGGSHSRDGMGNEVNKKPQSTSKIVPARQASDSTFCS